MANQQSENVHPISPPGNGGNGGSNFGERLARIETKMDTVATSKDISDIKTLIAEKEVGRKQDIADVRTEIAVVRTEIAVVRTEIAVVRTEIAQLATGLYRHMWFMGVGIVSLVFTLGKLFP